MISFWAFCMALLEFIFPLYVIKILNNNSHRLNSPEVKSNYGSLYYRFADNPTSNKFIIFILLKQYFYAIIININNSLTIVQNCLLLIVNGFFFVVLIKKSPYQEKIFYIQSIIMSIATVLITICNFFIASLSQGTFYYQIVFVISAIIHMVAFVSFFIIQIIRICKKKQLTKKVIDANRQYQMNILLTDTDQKN